MPQPFELWTIIGNIAKFKALLDSESDPEKRKTLKTLLAEENAKPRPKPQG